MKNVIAATFSFGLIAFIGMWYLLLGGSGKLLGTGVGLFTLVVIALSLGFSYKVLQNSNNKERVIFLAYFSSIILILYGLFIRIIEGMGRYQHPVGLKIFFIGLGSLIFLLILQFLYLLFFVKET